MSSKQKASGQGLVQGAHHRTPEVPISEGGALLVPVLEGEHNQHQVGSDPDQVPLDGLPDGLVQRAEGQLGIGPGGKVAV